MATVNTALSPYYDDFSPQKNYDRILFVGGRAVQARELTQLQTALQQQIKYQGDHIFKDGSPVLDGQTAIDLTCKYLRLYDNQGINNSGLTANVSLAYNPTTMGVGNGVVIIPVGANTVDGRTPRGRIIQAADATVDDPKTLILQYFTGDHFTANDAIKSLDGSFVGRVEDFDGITQPAGNSSVFNLESGIFYAKGFYIHTPKQSLILDKYNDSPTYRVGLTYSESTIDYIDDSTLLDNAAGTYNVNSPGADRLKVTLSLSVAPGSDGKTISDSAQPNFFELYRTVTGFREKVVTRPIYSELGKSMARRTFDESGDYVVSPFNVEVKENNATTPNSLLNIGISPGKAYVQGYEVEKLDKTAIPVSKARDVGNIAFSSVTDLGNYIKIKDISNGIFDISSMPIIDFHVANTQLIVGSHYTPTAEVSYDSTRIGNARVRSVERVINADPDVGEESISYNLFLFDIKANTIANAATSATTSQLTTDLKKGYLRDNIYVGGQLKITQAGQPTYNEVRRIIGYTASTGIFTVSPPFSATPSATTTFEISMGIEKAKSIRVGSYAQHELSADIANVGKVGTVSTGDTIVFEPTKKISIFPVGSSAVKKVADVNFRGVSSGMITAATDATTVTYSPATVGNFFQRFDAASPLTAIIANTSHGIITPESIVKTSDSVLTATYTTGTSPGLHSVVLTGNTTSALKSKSKVLGVSSILTVTTGLQSAVMETAREANGWVVFSTPNRVAGGRDILGMSDVISINKVIDSGNTGFAPNTYMLGQTSYDITNRYTLDTGQRDAFYDYGAAVLKAGVAPPAGQTAVVATYYTHSAGNGYFTVDSYSGPDYNTIGAYSTEDGRTLQLRDCIDFRPRRADLATGAAPPSTAAASYYNGFDSQGFLVDDSVLNIASIQHYLPRIDKLVITNNNKLKILQGKSSLYPSAPTSGLNDLVLYTLTYPAYTFRPRDVKMQRFPHRRYTMKDIDQLKQRVDRLQYYIAMNALERNASEMTVLDSTGTFERFKNGILAENFKSFGIANILSGDYRASLDITNGIMRPPTRTNQFFFNFDETTSGGSVQKTGDLITLPYTETTFVSQPAASTWINVNPYQMATGRGFMVLNPAGDIWTDTVNVGQEHLPVTGVDTGLQDYVDALNELHAPNLITFDYITHNIGEPVEGVFQGTSTTTRELDTRGNETTRRGGRKSRTETTTHDSWATEQTQAIEELVTTTQFGISEYTQDVGDRVVNEEIIPFIRSQGVLIQASALTQNTNIFAFFDNEVVTSYVARSNIITFNEDVEFDDSEGVYEYIENQTAPRAGESNGRLVAARGKRAYIVSSNGAFDAGDEVSAPKGGGNPPNLVGNNTTITVASYQHYSGMVQGSGASTVRLDDGAGSLVNREGVLSTPLGETIYIVSGTGIGQSRTISVWDASTKTATVSAIWTTIPDTTSAYSIGQLRTTEGGEFFGVFALPNNDTVRFLTGQKQFRLIDRSDNNDLDAGTMTQTGFFASGRRVEVKDQILTTRQPSFTSSVESTLGDEFQSVIGPVTQVETGQTFGAWFDPIAETILVDGNRYPQGIFVSSIDIFFKRKDQNNVPVTLQIRPTVNGYPSSRVVLPFASVTMGGIDSQRAIKVADADAGVFPDPTNDATYTRFTFPSPVYLTPNEYAIVMLSESLDYEVYISQIGGTKLAAAGSTVEEIVEQPYLGSFFKSQNGSTWTARQDQDLMFRINRCEFSTVPGTAHFDNSRRYERYAVGSTLTSLSSDYNYDLLYLKSDELNFDTTSVDYGYKGTPVGGAISTESIDIGANENVLAEVPQVISSGTDGSLKFSAYMQSSTNEISPVIDMERLGTIVLQNWINNGELSNTNFRIKAGGSGYTEGAKINVISQKTGTTATGLTFDTATFSVNVHTIPGEATGTVSGIWQRPGTNSGTGYLDSPLANVISLGAGAGSGAEIIVDGETGSLGGNVKARYVSKRVTLADGFDATDLNVFLTANKPAGTQIGVYYKIRSKSDSTPFDDNTWILMKQETPEASAQAISANQFREIKYVPYGVDEDVEQPIKYRSQDGAEYSTYNEFAIKITLISSTSVIVPKVEDLRAIALD